MWQLLTSLSKPQSIAEFVGLRLALSWDEVGKFGVNSNGQKLGPELLALNRASVWVIL